MPTNNFIQFNSNKTNMMDDSTYTQQAPQGIVGGGTIADSTLHNKLFYQLSTFTKAFGDLMTDKGLDASDENVSTLKENIRNLFGTQTSSSVDIVYNNYKSIYFTVDDTNFTKGNSDSTVPDSGIKKLLIQFKMFLITDDMRKTQNIYDTFPLAYDELFFMVSGVYGNIGRNNIIWNFASDNISEVDNTHQGRVNDIGFRFQSTIYSIVFGSSGTDYMSYIAVGIVNS